MQPGGDVLIGQAVGAEQNYAHAGHQAMGQRARTSHRFQLLALFRLQLQRGQGSSQAHRHLHSPQKMPKGKSSRNTYISYLRDTTLASSISGSRKEVSPTTVIVLPPQPTGRAGSVLTSRTRALAGACHIYAHFRDDPGGQRSVQPCSYFGT